MKKLIGISMVAMLLVLVACGGNTADNVIACNIYGSRDITHHVYYEGDTVTQIRTESSHDVSALNETDRELSVERTIASLEIQGDEVTAEIVNDELVSSVTHSPEIMDFGGDTPTESLDVLLARFEELGFSCD